MVMPPWGGRDRAASAAGTTTAGRPYTRVRVWQPLNVGSGRRARPRGPQCCIPFIPMIPIELALPSSKSANRDRVLAVQPIKERSLALQ